jgi:hypothetical protein
MMPTSVLRARRPPPRLSSRLPLRPLRPLLALMAAGSLVALSLHAAPATGAGPRSQQEGRAVPSEPVAAAAPVRATGVTGPRSLLPQRPAPLHAGVFSSGFEVEAFRPCGLDEAWWVVSLDARLAARYREVALTAYQPVYAVFRGEPSEKGSTGHLGRYDRTLRVVEVLELRPAREDDCRPARRGGGWIAAWEASDGAGLNPLTPGA